ncbi:hypothetical protein JBE04_19025 [Streptomyces sp. PRKS01-29]|nr:hypothetical protein [Streptomyces sabulosicollis]
MTPASVTPAAVPVRYAPESAAPPVHVTDVATRPAGRLSGGAGGQHARDTGPAPG